jgi:methylmalonyl-CoA/ethylmalonyl-CoA epimerase
MIFDHIGIVVKDVDAAVAAAASLFGAHEATRRFDDEVLGVSVRFVRDPSGIVYEMIAPLGAESPVAQALESRTNLLNQIAYRTPALAPSVMALRKQGSMSLGPAKPAKAFDGAKVQFLLSELGFIIELIEAPDFRHQFFPL